MLLISVVINGVEIIVGLMLICLSIIGMIEEIIVFYRVMYISVRLMMSVIFMLIFIIQVCR